MDAPRPTTVFLTSAAGSRAPSFVIGGLTILERKLFEAARRGATRAVVACEGELPRRPVALAIERVVAGSPPPAGVEVVAADEVAGIKVATAADAARAEWALFHTLPKTFQGPIDALVNHHVSLRITRVLCRTSITPNQVTVFALGLGLLAAALLVWGGGGAALIAAGVVLFFQSVFDSCDGELARLRFQFSKLGQWLDNLGDDLCDATLIAALGWAAGGPWRWLGLAGAAGRVVTQVALYLQVRTIGDFNGFRWWFESDVVSIDAVYRKDSPITHLRSLGRRDVYVFTWAILVAVAAIWPTGLVLAAAYGVFVSAGYLVLTILHLALHRRSAQVSGSGQAS